MRWPLRSVLAPKICSAIVLLGARALAQPNDPAPGVAANGQAAAPLRLSWISSEPECGEDLVAARALQMVGRNVTPPQVEARAEVSRDGSIWTVKLETRSAKQTGTRVVSGETCKEIQDAVALLLTLILESEVDAAPSPVPPLPDAPAAPATSPEQPSKPLSGVTPNTEAISESAIFDDPEPEEPASQPDDARRELGVLVRLHGGATLGLLQRDVGAGFGGAFGLHWDSWDLALTGSYWPSTRVLIPESMGYVEIARLGAGVRGCFTAWSPGNLSVAGCLLPELTLFRFESFEIGRPRQGGADHVLVSGTAALELRYRLFGRYVSAVLSPGVTWEKSQPFHVRGLCAPRPCVPPPPLEVHDTVGVGGRLEIGVDARF